MKAIILCAGYATRLYPLTENFPKPLLPISNKPLLEHIIEKINEIPVNEIIIISNHKLINHFKRWREDFQTNLSLKILDDGSTSEENKLGALKDLSFALEKEKIDEDFLVVARDNIHKFSFSDFHNKFKKLNNNLIAVHDMQDLEKVRKKYGVVLLDKNEKVINFQEKPENPKSTMKSICCYLFKPIIKPLLLQYLQSNNPDATGYFVEWLIKQKPVYAFQFSEPVYDVGNLESYEEVKKNFDKDEY